MKRSSIFISIIFLLMSVSFADESSTYDFGWLDSDKEVYVLQNRKYRKKGSVTVSAMGGMTTSGAFTNATVTQGRFGYFFTETLGVEGLFSKNFSKENTTANAVYAVGAVPFIRRTESYLGGMLLWSPFYAKINTFNSILYFDWIFGLGAASLTDSNNRNNVGTSSRSSQNWVNESHTGILWDIGLRFYLSEMFSVRLDFTGVHYKATQYTGSNSSIGNKDLYYENYDLLAGLNIAF